MAVEKNAIYKVHNGVDFDTINFKTIASQVKMASGVDLESGFLNSKGVTGYTKLPNGLILQWGWIATPSEGGYGVTLPITFPNGIFRVLTSVDSTSFHNVRTYSASTSRFNLATTGGNAETSISWIVLGY